MNIHLLIACTSVLIFGTIHTQPTPTKTNETAIFSINQYPANSNPTKIKWTWQLPASVKSGFNKTQYTTWFVEKIIRYDANGKTVYRLFVNNGNLLDGDHHDSFLKTYSLNITADGTVLNN